MKRKMLWGLPPLLSLIFMLAGCCGTPPEPKLESKPAARNERGWIGGEYEEVGRAEQLNGLGWAGQLPRPLVGYYRRGVLLTSLGSNAPARLAGLRGGDVIVQLNHQPLSNSSSFLRTIDRAEPGTLLPVTAWRDGQTIECNVVVGRETWTPGGNFSISVPATGPLDLLHNDRPGFSLIVLGYEPGFGRRSEIDNPQNRYLKKNDLGEGKPNEAEWSAWLVLFSVQRWKQIDSQETVPLKTASLGHL